MPYKHQDDSYRTRNGIRYTGYTDCCAGDSDQQKAKAKDIVARLRATGRPAFYEHHADGYYRVFAEERKKPE